MSRTRKNTSSQGIEMQEIPIGKRLGRREPVSVGSMASNRSIGSNSFNRSKKIYRERVKKSVCRKKKREVCVKSCKYTRGRIRKYCRKRRNESVRF
jgi:hypothetical protein